MPDNRSLFSVRRLLFVDAATCFVMGAILALGAGPLSELLELPRALLFWAGLALFPIAAFMAFVASRPVVPAIDAWLVVAGNVAWIIGSVLLLVAGWAQPNALGTGFVLGQALAVAVLAGLEIAALRGARLVPQPGR